MTLDLTVIVNVFALLSCAFLLVFWLVISRKLAGFFYVVAGWVTIVVAVRSDHRPIHLAGILVAAIVIVGLLVASHAALKVRRRAHSYRVYRPTAQPRRAAHLAERRPR